MRKNLQSARKAAGLTQQAMADKLESRANETLNALIEIRETGNVDHEFYCWLRKFLIHFDEKYCDIMTEIEKSI